LAVEYSTWLVAMVRILVSSRRPCDSEAFATSSYGTNFAHPLSAATFVSAAVRVVLPWSMCPIVPTFTCGLDRSNFSLAIEVRSVSVLPGLLREGPTYRHRGAGLAKQARRRYFVPWIRATTSSLTLLGACS